jgi:hypothetical protein
MYSVCFFSLGSRKETEMGRCEFQTKKRKLNQDVPILSKKEHVPTKQDKNQDIPTSKKWQLWYIQKQLHFACSKEEFLLMLKIVTQHDSFAEKIHKTHFLSSVRSRLKTRFDVPYPFFTGLGTIPFSTKENAMMTVKSGYYKSLLQLSFQTTCFKEMEKNPLLVPGFSFYTLSHKTELPKEIVIKLLLWNLFKDNPITFLQTRGYIENLCPTVIKYLEQLEISNLPHGSIQVTALHYIGRNKNDNTEEKLKLFLTQIEHQPGFCLPSVLFPQHLGQMDVEDIDWKSVFNLFPDIDIVKRHLFIQLLRMFASLFFVCNVPVFVDLDSKVCLRWNDVF